MPQRKKRSQLHQLSINPDEFWRLGSYRYRGPCAMNFKDGKYAPKADLPREILDAFDCEEEQINFCARNLKALLELIRQKLPQGADLDAATNDELEWARLRIGELNRQGQRIRGHFFALKKAAEKYQEEKS